MFGMAGETEFDLRFRLLGIPVRVHPIFWLSTGFMVWGDGNLPFVAIGVLSIFVSILVHELGHALVIRRYGYPSEIVLYFFCGYATSSHFPFRRAVAVSAAGPAAGLLLGGLVYLIRSVLPTSLLVEYPLMSYGFRMLLFAGIIVNVLNLIPCLPLDGGQIMSAVVRHYRIGGVSSSELVLKVSIGVAGAAAAWAAVCNKGRGDFFPAWLYMPFTEDAQRLLTSLQPDPQFMMIFMGYLCVSSVLELNRNQSWR